jgi:hypothetical protein
MQNLGPRLKVKALEVIFRQPWHHKADGPMGAIAADVNGVGRETSAGFGQGQRCWSGRGIAMLRLVTGYHCNLTGM